MPGRTVLWWGRFDPDYSRNRIIRRLLADLGWRIRNFRPRISATGDVEATLRGIPAPQLVWVPCFRQRDMAAAARWTARHNVPTVFDPLISAWDKRVFERGKFAADDRRARKLLGWERRLFAAADMVLADTDAHRDFFVEAFGLDEDRVAVVPVGAEDDLFTPLPPRRRADGVVEILFYGTFISLHGPQTIIEAARLYDGPPVIWHLLGQGPLLRACRKQARELSTVIFEPYLAYEKLPARIGEADILLGVFGASDKAGRVIPNKVFQALACGRPVITRAAPAYPSALAGSDGIAFVPANQPQALAATVADWAGAPDRLAARCDAAASIHRQFFANDAIRDSLRGALSRLVKCD
jgi:glycosyltransferase involved in cell wall biosynthesis